MKKLLSLMLALLAVVMCVCGCSRKNEESDIVMESENVKIGIDEYQYYLAFTFSTFANQYGDFMSSMFDTTKPLRSQESPFGNTWFEYFSDGATETLKEQLAVAEYAKAEGITLSDEEQKEVDEELANIYAMAKDSGYADENEYLKAQYGSLVTKDTLEKCFNLYYLAQKCFTQIYNSEEYTDADYEAYADENKSSVYKADFLFVRIGTEPAENATEAELKAALEKSRDRAIRLNNAVTDEASFIAEAEKYFREVYTIGDKTDAENNVYTEEDIKSMAEGCRSVGVPYNDSVEAARWVYDEARIAGEHYVAEDPTTGCCEVYFMLKPVYRQEDNTVSVRHILIDSDSAKGSESAEQMAERILENWKGTDATEKGFSLLAAEHSVDTGSSGNGGLYENINPGDMVEAFNDWCFDPARKEGDTGIVETEYGYHIMYFVSHGLPGWKAVADTGLRDAVYKQTLESIKAEHKVTLYEDMIDNVPDLTGN